MRTLKNIGLLDRIIRLLVGAGLYSLGFLETNGLEYLAILGPIIALSAIVGMSPLYWVLGVSTRKKD